ncbi:alpha/beta fold hydrolase [Streptomyces sp. NPDC059568]|uniref:alpha/beta fold hydrolase n=1 Tax=Streptomyces sp. NPDC059568 TaxID=3346868 RepID=UPI0036BCF6D5
MSHARSHASRRTVLALATGAALAGIAVPALAAGTTDKHSATTGHTRHTTAKPTVVLVHGAWADSSSWGDVVNRLQAQGYPVLALANPLRGLAQDSAYLESRLNGITGPVVLVGHSYGGAVITEAAAHVPNVKALVYVAGFAPAKNESIGALTAKYPGSHATPDALNVVPYDTGDTGGTKGVDIYIKPDKFRDVFAAALPQRQTNTLAAVQRPIDAGAFDETATAAAWETIPSWYLVTRDDHAIPPATQRFMAERAHAHTTEVTAPHAVMLTRPDAVTNIIRSAATATR